MKTRTPFTQAYDQLPDTLPVFPLEGAVLFPGGTLPLNIFEPRYLNMIQDAIKTHRLIGMIQPLDQRAIPELYQVGCAGRITRYLETTDGRFEIVLTGVCRFRVQRELETVREYRMVVPGWSEFESDYDDQSASESAVAMLHASLRAYFDNHGIDADWSLLDQLEPGLQASTLVGALSLDNEDKQLLLETPNLEERLRAFAALLIEKDAVSVQQH
jgi:Lon protease-like protein